jgi:hypothetical protein
MSESHFLAFWLSLLLVSYLFVKCAFPTGNAVGNTFNTDVDTNDFKFFPTKLRIFL